MRQTVFRQLHELYPGRIVNKTNGISFRRWLMQANPRLSKLLCEVCGAAVLDDQTKMARLAEQANDSSLQERFGTIKRANKIALARLISSQGRLSSIQMTNSKSRRPSGMRCK
jgi:starch phosphorylase